MPRANKQPIKVPTGGSYGQATALAKAQAAIPLPAGGALSTAEAPTSAGSPPDPTAAYQAAQQHQPGPLTPLGAPSDRPGEHITTGLGQPAAPMQAPTGPDPDVMAMAQYLPLLEMLAARPNASMTTRAFVRGLRSKLPPDFNFGA